MTELVPVDHDPFAGAQSQPVTMDGAQLRPVDHDPFAGVPAPKQSLGDVLSETWPAKLAKSVYDAVTAPGDAYQGKFAPQPETPGILTEEDAFRQNYAKDRESRRALDVTMNFNPLPTAMRGGEGWGGAAKTSPDSSVRAGVTWTGKPPAPAAPPAAPPTGIVQDAIDYVAPLTQSGQERLASKELRRSATNPAAAAERLAEPAEIVPGSQPTTFQQTGDMGLGALERNVANKNNTNAAAFNDRLGAQNVARTRAVKGLQETGSPADIPNFLRGQLRAIEEAGEQGVSRATAEAQGAAERIGGTRAPEQYGEAIQAELAPGIEAATRTARTQVEGLGGVAAPEEYGAAMRGTLAEARAAAKAHERGLWTAVDPGGTLTLRANSLKQTAREIEAGMTPSARPIAGEERAIFDAIGTYRSLTPFREITDLRSRVSTAMREELRASGETPTYARLARLRGAIEQAISNAVQRKAGQEAEAVARGELAPEQTTGSMLQRFAGERDAWLAGRTTNARTRDGGVAGPVEPAAAPPVPTAPGAQGAGGGRPGGPAGNPGVPEVPNFDAAAQERLTAATTATRERKRAFDSGQVGTLLKNEGMQGQYRKPDAMVPEAVFKPGPGGFEAVQAFRRGVGNDQQAIGILQDYAAASLRRAAERPDGTLDVAQYGMWRRKHQDALRAVPGLRERFDTASRASESLAAPPIRPDVSAAHVPEQFFRPGVGGFEAVGRLRSEIGDTRALNILGDYAASRLRAAAMRPDNTLDPAKFATWQRTHADALRAFPELNTRFTDAAKATEAIETAAAARKAALDAHQQGAFGKLIGVSEPEDVTRVVGGLFGQKNAVGEFKRLAEQTAGDPAARDGLRKAIADHITNKFVSNTEGATTGAGLIRADQFQTFVQQNAQALRQVFSDEEVTSLRAIAADLQRANRSITAVKRPGGSDTAQNVGGTLLKMLSHPGVHTAGGLGTGGLIGFQIAGVPGAIVGGTGGYVLSSMRQAGLKEVDDLVKAAMLDPAIARMLLMRASSKPDRGPAWRLAQYLSRGLAATLWENTSVPTRTDTGERHKPVRVESPADVLHGAERTALPTPAQAVAGNYSKRHLKWNGLDLSVETEAGQERTGMGADGKPWSTVMAHPYGYVRGTVSKDGEPLDFYLGPHPNAQTAFVFDQVDPKTGAHDEPKLVIGARDLSEARSVYDSGFSDNSGQIRRGAVREFSVGELKNWLANGNLKKPVSYEGQGARSRTAQSSFSIKRPQSIQDLMDDPRSAADIRKELGMQTA